MWEINEFVDVKMSVVYSSEEDLIIHVKTDNYDTFQKLKEAVEEYYAEKCEPDEGEIDCIRVTDRDEEIVIIFLLVEKNGGVRT